MLASLLLFALSIVPDGERFNCTPTHVWDGDGPIVCAEGARVRLSGISARELNETCRQNQPCPTAGGIAARNALIAMLGKPIGVTRQGLIAVRGPALSCTSVGSAGKEMTAAWCTSPKAGDLSCAMVEKGYALKWDKYWKGHRCSWV